MITLLYGLTTTSLWIARYASHFTRIEDRQLLNPRWLVAPAVRLASLLMLGTNGFDIPMKVWLRLIGPPPDAYVEDLAPSEGFQDWELLQVPWWMNGFGISQVQQAGDAVRFSQGGNFLDGGGFAYLPSGVAEQPGAPWFGGRSFTHLTGDWNAWERTGSD